MCAAGLTSPLLDDQSAPVQQSTLRIMARIDAFDVEDPYNGSRQMVGYCAWLQSEENRISLSERQRCDDNILVARQANDQGRNRRLLGVAE